MGRSDGAVIEGSVESVPSESGQLSAVPCFWSYLYRLSVNNNNALLLRSRILGNDEIEEASADFMESALLVCSKNMSFSMLSWAPLGIERFDVSKKAIDLESSIVDVYQTRS